MIKPKFSVFILLVLFTLNGCSSNKASSDKKVFRFNESAGINSLDPAFARVLEDMRAINQIYDGLLVLDDSLKVKPCIARDFLVSEDGLEYTFNLKTGVFFTPDSLFKHPSKREVNAHDFVYSFNRILDPKVASPGMWIFQNVNKETTPGFEAVNDSTLKIYLKQPFPAFPGILTMQYCNVVPREVVEHYGNDFRSNPVGCGPFRMAFWLEGVSLVLHKNPEYWMKTQEMKDIPFLDAVRIDFVRDKSSMFLDFLKGKYDFISGIDQSYKDEILDENGELVEAYKSKINFQKVPFIKTDYIGFLVDPEKLKEGSPLLSKEFRNALNFAVNRKELVRYLRNNTVFPAENGFLPKGFAAHGLHNHLGYTYDLEKAKELLKKSGVLPLSEPVVISTTSAYVDICEFLQHQWSLLGIEVEIETLQSSNHRELVANSEIKTFRKSWLADYSDEENFLGLFYSKNFSPSGPNYTHFNNAEFDSLFEAALLETEYEDRKKLYGAMDSIILTEAPIVPLFYDQVSHFLQKNIQNFTSNPVNMLDLTFVDKN